MSPAQSGKTTDADAERLFAVLLAYDAKGQPRFTEAQILTYLPLLMMSAGIKLESSPSALAVFQRVAAIVGAVPLDSDVALAKKLADHFLAHPPPPGLQEAFAVFCRLEAGGVTADSLAGFIAGQAR